MAEKFFELDSQLFRKFLEHKGFKQLDTNGEVVYVRHHHKHPHLMVKVYTTISPNQQVRKNGSDAIRVVAVFDNGTKNFGIGKFPRIYRRAPEEFSNPVKNNFVFQKVLVRMRDAYKRCNEWMVENNYK